MKHLLLFGYHTFLFLFSSYFLVIFPKQFFFTPYSYRGPSRPPEARAPIRLWLKWRARQQRYRWTDRQNVSCESGSITYLLKKIDFPFFYRRTDGLTDRRTGWMDWPTRQRMERPSYKEARTHLRVCPSVGPYVQYSARPSVPPSVPPSARPPIRPSVRLPIHPSLNPSVRLSIHPPLCPSVRLSICGSCFWEKERKSMFFDRMRAIVQLCNHTINPRSYEDASLTLYLSETNILSNKFPYTTSVNKRSFLSEK